MAVAALLDASLVINSVDLSDHVKSVSVDADIVELESSAMGDEWKTIVGGIKNGSITVEFYNDFAAASVDATLWAAFTTTPVTFVYKPDSGAVSTSNPSYSGSILLSGITVGGSHGELPMVSKTYPVDGAVTRATA